MASNITLVLYTSHDFVTLCRLSCVSCSVLYTLVVRLHGSHGGVMADMSSIFGAAKLLPGCYALDVQGALPEHIEDLIEDRRRGYGR